jgi:probable addiction module antidote protein
MRHKRHGLDAVVDRDQKMIVKLLNEAFSTQDTSAIVKTIGNFLRARGMSKVAQKTGLERAGLYRSFRGHAIPRLDRVMRALATLEVELVAKRTDRSKGVLNDAFSTGDPTVIVKTIGDLLRFRGMSEMARKSGLDRRTLYTSFDGQRAPNLDRVIRVLAALEVELVTKPIHRTGAHKARHRR